MKTILLVEDEAIIAMKEADILKKAEYEVLIASDARQAIAQMKGESIVDLILMDINLGDGMNGIEAAEIILHNCNIPIIFLTSYSRSDIVYVVERIQCYGYVMKNSPDIVLLNTINIALNLFSAKEKLKNDLNMLTASLKNQYLKTVGGGNKSLITAELCDAEVDNLLKPIVPAEDERKIPDLDYDILLSILSSIPVGLLVVNKETVITHANDPIGVLVFHEPSDIIGKRAGGGLGCVHSQYDPRGCGFSPSCSECILRKSIESILASGGSRYGVLVNPTLIINGEPQERWLSVNIEYLDIKGARHAVISVDDVTDRKRIEEQMEQLAHEKELLMKELQHRIKNSLTTILSIIGIEMDKTPDAKSNNVLKDIHSRIHTMAIMYGRLYNSGNYKTIDLDLYIKDIIDLFCQAFMVEMHDYQLIANLSKIQTDAKRALLIGIILNELITNIFKYAYPNGGKKIIRVGLDVIDQQLLLNVSDDGIGLPEGFNLENVNSMGFQIIKMFTRQMKGTLHVESSTGGTRVSICVNV
jgi:two-component sensor histidine kinase/DNA-binding NarL/FixJ family response regulator